MRIDAILQSDFCAEEMVELGRLAEDCGLGGVWVANSFATRDAFVNFVPLAQQTRLLRMGPIALSPYELHPLKMAISLLTLNEFAQGRAQIVVGGGGGTALMMGQKPRRMIRAVRECVEIINQAIAGKPAPYKGELYSLDWLDVRWPAQPAPAIYVGANGPQMLKAAAGYAEAIMLSDFVAARVRWAHQIIDPVLQKTDRDVSSFPLSNFWAWHVKASREEAQREARIYLAVRGTIYPDYIRDVVSDDEAKIVTEHINSFMLAYQKRSAEIEGVPDDILEKIVYQGVSASTIADIDREVERMRTFQDAGLTEIALCIYSDPADAIRLIGKHLIPGLR
jgi:5,10-methylenetetrahydromethanopterin reductase